MGTLNPILHHPENLPPDELHPALLLQPTNLKSFHWARPIVAGTFRNLSHVILHTDILPRECENVKMWQCVKDQSLIRMGEPMPATAYANQQFRLPLP